MDPTNEMETEDYPVGAGEYQNHSDGERAAIQRGAINTDSIAKILINSMDDHELMHYGVGKMDGAPGRGSGRYPLGSGENPNQRAGDFISIVKQLRKEGLSDTEIAKGMGMTTGEFRDQCGIAKAEYKAQQTAIAKKLLAQGMNPTQIAREMGYNSESSVRNLLNTEKKAKESAARKYADFLKEQVDKKGMIEVGEGVELEMGISLEKKRQALTLLSEEGYPTHRGRVENATNPEVGTTITVLCPPGTPHSDIFNHPEKIHSLNEYKSVDLGDGDEMFVKKFHYPASMDSKRLMINYADTGTGDLKDGVVEIRRGVKDLSLGDSNYAQVRILVDGTHYIKGMAVYADDLPKGIDVRFNTNKNHDVSKLDVLKEIKNDPQNPFGSLIKEKGGQSYYFDSDGKKKLSLINKRADEGDWNDWADKVPSQFLSKQPMKLINQQLNLSKAQANQQFDEIMRITNPTLKKDLLMDFAQSCDSNAIHLKAAALPRQKYKVILPLTTGREDEIYAPSYKDGTRLALIRYPHGGTFEIPLVKVNNKNAEGKRVITPGSVDAIGIHKAVADRLSGADFDGDTVMCIPLKGNVKVNSTDELKGLKGFDPKVQYSTKGKTGVKLMTKEGTQGEMGRISNLITDMTIKGATTDELARAVRHSMVVIDAHKHKLDYKQSEKDNGILELKKKYQAHINPETGKTSYGASTLISMAKSQQSVVKRQGSARINEDGSLSWKTTDNPTYSYTTKTGKVVTKTKMQKSTKMAETSDARTLISKYDTQVEHAYADYANHYKSLANRARKEYLNTKEIPYSASAAKTYAKEVKSLNSKLMVARYNQPKERYAQIIAKSTIKAKQDADPDLSKKDLKKIRQQAITEARIRVGAQRNPIVITDDEFKAIQAGAISKTRLNKILRYTNKDVLKQKAMPRNQKDFTDSQKALMKAMKNSGLTLAEIGERFGISASTVSNAIK